MISDNDQPDNVDCEGCGHSRSPEGDFCPRCYEPDNGQRVHVLIWRTALMNPDHYKDEFDRFVTDLGSGDFNFDLTQFPRYLVLGRRWHQATYGNTYHTVRVIDLLSGKTVVESPRTYGYGDQYFQTAWDGLKALGFVDEAERFDHELNRARFIKDVVDVGRRRDL